VYGHGRPSRALGRMRARVSGTNPRVDRAYYERREISSGLCRSVSRSFDVWDARVERRPDRGGRDAEVHADHAGTDESNAALMVRSEELAATTYRYIVELVRAGVFVAAEGLDDAGQGVMVDFSGETRWSRTGPTGGPGPTAVGLLGDPPWAGRADQGIDSRPRPLRPAGRDRRRPRVGALRRGDRLGPDRWCSMRRSAGSRPSPLVELNRAVAVAMASGPAQAPVHRGRAVASDGDGRRGPSWSWRPSMPQPA
jgi:hypothetical protein